MSLVDSLRKLDEGMNPIDKKRDSYDLDHVCLLILDRGISENLAKELARLLDVYSANLKGEGVIQ